MMKLLVTSCVVLLCISLAQANVGYVHLYDFDSLVPGLTWPTTALNANSDSMVAWSTAYHPTTGAPVNPMSIFVGGEMAGGTVVNQNANWLANSTERLCSSLQPGVGSTLFTPNTTGQLESTDKHILLSFNMYHRPESWSWIAGIWVDLDDNNAMANNEDEAAVQFGLWPHYDPSDSERFYRVRGAAGTPQSYSGGYVYNGLPSSLFLGQFNAKMELYLDLETFTADLVVTNLDLSVSATVVSGAPIVSAAWSETQRDLYLNPENWTGWTIRNQSLNTALTLDNLRLEVIPEPATLTLLVLGGLACLRRRR